MIDQNVAYSPEELAGFKTVFDDAIASLSPLMLTTGNRLRIAVASADPTPEAVMIAHLARFLAVPPTAIALQSVPELPLTATGKKDYKALEGTR